MKRSTFITFIILLHVGFVLLEIVKQNHMAKLSYTNQRLHNRLQALQQQEQDLLYQHAQQQNIAAVDKYARETLDLKPLTLSKVQRLSYESR